MYQFPCPTDGRCRAIAMEGIKGWREYVFWGTKRIFGVKFRCCTQCHLPLNKREADRLNRELGYTPNDIEIDSNFLDLLNGIE